jgi:hypothetical protein
VEIKMHSEYMRTRRAAEVMAVRLGFYIHAAVFATVVVALALLNVLTARDELWVQWVALGWGAGVALHAVLVFGRWPRRMQTWQLRKIRDLRAQM